MAESAQQWSLMEYFQIFFPSTYSVTAVEMEEGQVCLYVANPGNGATAWHDAPLSDFLDICCMAAIAIQLRDRLKPRRLALVV